MAEISKGAAPPTARPRAALRAIVQGPGRLHRAVLLGVLALAALLRFWGLRFGLPYFEHPDEWAVAEEALRMLATSDFRPFSYTYPTLYVYMQVGVAAAHFLAGAGAGLYRTPADIDPARFYVWARALTATLGLGTVGLTYLAGRWLYGRWAGLAAALLLAALPTAAGDAHYVTVDTPAAFFTVLAFLAIIRLAGAQRSGIGSQASVDRRSPAADRPWPIVRRALLAGAAVGLAASTKYNVGVLVAPLLLASTIAAVAQPRPEARGYGRALGLAIAALSGVALGFTLGTPLWLAELPRLLSDLGGIAAHYRVDGHPGAESSRPALFYWGALAFEATLLAWAMLAGLLLAVVRRARADLLVLALVVPYMLQLSSVRVVFFRNAVPLLPFACLLAGAALAWAAGRLEQRRPAAPAGRDGAAPAGPARLLGVLARPALLLSVALAIVVAQPLARALRDEWLRAQPTTRVLATEWVLARAPEGSRIWLEDQTLILPDRLRVQGGQPLTSHAPDWYREQGFRLLVVNASIAKSDAAQLAAFGEPAARFEAGGQRYGHTFLIYDTGLGDVAGEPRTPSGATLGGGLITLEGYRHAGRVAPGEVLPLALYWRANQAIDRNYTVFVHLLDAQGGKLAQRDMQPLDGSRPSSGWRSGELIRDDQDLRIPAGVPPGRYRLVVGMYDPETMAAITEAGPIAIGEVEVGP